MFVKVTHEKKRGLYGTEKLFISWCCCGVVLSHRLLRFMEMILSFVSDSLVHLLTLTYRRLCRRLLENLRKEGKKQGYLLYLT